MLKSAILSPLLLAAGLLLAPGLVAPVQAQTAPEAYPAAAQLKDGAFRRGGQTYQLLGGQQTRLSETLRLGNGTELRPDGRLVRNGVTRQILQNGQAVTMEGNVVLLRDDMLTPAAIARADKAATGGSTTTISVPAAANLAALVPQLERTASRFAQLQQLTALLEQRAAALAAGTTPSAGLAREIQDLSTQLSR
ncbi:DUF6799 domain-containing protein [Hymenobacter aerophilus]|uniref:DUF6799 domain-containing protein n=1 Tax=Hymenobacter aerophilus TaxID=119644 RepID=UPI00035CCBCB|nr:DUF6799 domain-containing protein [Hymenobacter aerophilus]